MERIIDESSLAYQVAMLSPAVNQEQMLLAKGRFRVANFRNRYELLKNPGIFYNWQAYVDLVTETELRFYNRF